MQDDDTHWYLVPLEEVELFKERMPASYHN
jgi:hypothetical protein